VRRQPLKDAADAIGFSGARHAGRHCSSCLRAGKIHSIVRL